MKTTIDISNALYEEVRRVAQVEGTTVRALVEEGLRHTLAEHRRRVPFTLRNATFKGNGLRPEFAGASWDQIRNSVYEGRGG
ncbi:MAG: type II toxin-antitoxin system VapB family antitoxin [Kiritimatiellae bacterium]|nr:type II toxin-antitoxin system VapB family antitoxin [Kiritimatiellia bacterium]